MHCYLDDRTKPGPSKETWLDVLDQLYEMGVFSLMLSGGEVFLRQDIWEILERIKKYRFQVKVKTQTTCGCHFLLQIEIYLLTFYSYKIKRTF